MAGNTANVTLNIFGDVPEAQAQRHYRQLAQQLKEELEMETVSGQRLPIGVYSSR
jgi:inorganic triphosphatase YgiF